MGGREREQANHPVLISVPHAGRAYPPRFSTMVRMSADQLRPLEDRYADLLAKDATALGIPTLIAQTPRCWIDLNRRETDIDELLVSLPAGRAGGTGMKVRAGLGLIPRRLARGGDIWRDKISPDDMDERISTIHRPWHQAIAEMLRRVRQDYGCAVLIDLHSMPTPLGRDAPQIVVGDLFGQSASGPFSQLAMHMARQSGFRAALNSPYAGGHTLERHGNPATQVHALQIEVDRSLYLDRDHDRPIAAISKVQDFVARLATALAEEALSTQFPMAAE